MGIQGETIRTVIDFDTQGDVEIEVAICGRYVGVDDLNIDPKILDLDAIGIASQPSTITTQLLNIVEFELRWYQNRQNGG